MSSQWRKENDIEETFKKIVLKLFSSCDGRHRFQKFNKTQTGEIQRKP